MHRQTRIPHATAFLVLFVATCVFSASTPGSPVTELIGKMPAPSAQAGAKLNGELVRLGPGAVQEICDLLVPPGTDDDTKARFALSGLAKHVGRAGAETERRMLASILQGALQKEADVDVQAFLIRQFQVAGMEESVPVLCQYITNKALCEPAVQALLAIGSETVGPTLLQALPAVQYDGRVTIIKALGDLQSTAAAKALLPYAKSDDEKTRRTALYAIANIGHPSAGKVLAKAAACKEPYERGKAASFYLLYAKRLAESGKTGTCERICRKLMKGHSAANDLHVRCAALSTLVAVRGERANKYLLKAMSDDAKAFRETALGLAENLPGEELTQKWIEKQGKVCPTVREEIIAMLGRRGDCSALPTVLETLTDSAVPVRISAVEAAVRLDSVEAGPALLTVLRSAEEAEEIAAIQSAFLRTPGQESLSAIAEALPSLAAPARVAMLEILSVRRDEKNREAVFAQAKDADVDIRKAAITALGNLAGVKEQSRLIELLLNAKNDDERGVAQNVVVAIAEQIEDPERRADAALSALEKSRRSRRAVLLQTLARLGGKDALKAVTADTLNNHKEVRHAAIRSLGEWPDASASRPLLKVLKNADARADQERALQSTLNLLKSAELQPGKRVRLYQRALGIVTEPDDKKALLAGLAEVQHVSALKVAAACLRDEALREDAALCVVQIVCPKSDEEIGIRGPRSYGALKTIIATTKNESVRDKAKEHLATITPPDRLNLAYRKPSTATTSHEGENAPDRAVDGQVSLDSAWHGKPYPSSLQVELRELAQIDTVHVFLHWDGSRFYRYTIDLSTDGEKWQQVVDRRENAEPATAEGFAHRFAPTQAKYVRLNLIENSANTTVHVVELKVYAAGKSPEGLAIYTPNPPAPLSAPDLEGFVSLFNGEDLSGWVGDTKGYLVENGTIVCKPGGNLFTRDAYGDFILRFEFKLPPDGANNGLGIRAPLHGNAAYMGMELQILDNTADVYKNLKAYQYHGSIYGVVPAKRGYLRPLGEWNYQEVIADGPNITVILNGVIITQGNIDEAKPLDGQAHPGLKRKDGHIGFLGHGSKVEFRNLRIKKF